MKKILYILALIIVLVLAFASCKNDENANDYVTTPEETTPEPPTTHVWGEWIVVKEAKCEEKGLLQRYCTECYYTESKPIDALGHTEVIDEAVDPTCTETGLTEGKHCSVCGEILAAQTVIPVLGHTEAIDEKVAPTCTETGLTEGKHCSVCGEVLIAQVVIEATGHSFSKWITTKEPTETDEGLKERTCACGEKETQIIKLAVGLEYTLNDDGVSYSVTGIGTCTDTDIVIPTEYKGLPVTTIGEYAFCDCTNLTSVTIGDSVTTIGKYAFYGCDRLTSVTIPDSVTTIGDGVFFNCTKLTSVTIPDSVTTIGLLAFYNCSNLTNVTIGDSVTTIGEYAFCDCTNLTSVTIGDSVTTIGESAFCDCTNLTSVTIGDSVTTIGYNAFYNCYNLTSVTIPDSVTTIGYGAFYNCFNLTSVTIGDSVTTISYYAFEYCDNLKSVTFANPNGWECEYYYDSTNVKAISASNLSNPTTAAQYLRSKYCWYYWHRTE